jgi:AcrR family transcriptional regulator
MYTLRARFRFAYMYFHLSEWPLLKDESIFFKIWKINLRLNAGQTGCASSDVAGTRFPQRRDKELVMNETPRAQLEPLAFDRILSAAKLHIGLRGVVATRLSDIAETAQVSQQLIFHYFQSKKCLAEMALAAMSEESLAFIRSVTVVGLEPREALELLIRGLVRQILVRDGVMIEQGLKGPKYISIKNRIGDCMRELRARVEQIITLGQAGGAFSRGFDASQVIQAVHGLTLGRMTAAAVPGMTNDDPRAETSLAQLEDFVVDFVLRALRP